MSAKYVPFTGYEDLTECPSSYNLSQISARAKRDFAHLFG